MLGKETREREEEEEERKQGGGGPEKTNKSFSHTFSLNSRDSFLLSPLSLPFSPITMRSTLASTRARASTRSSTVAARASSTGKQQQAVAKPASSIIDSRERSSATSTLPIAARVFSAVAAAMVAVTGPAFADLNAFEAAAGGGKKEKNARATLKREEPRKKKLSFSRFLLSTSTSLLHLNLPPRPQPPSSKRAEFGIGSAQQFGDATINGKDFSKQDLRRSNFTSAECR